VLILGVSWLEKELQKKVIDYLAERVPAMFKDGKVAGQMKKGGSPMRIMNRAEVQEMWAKREASLKVLLAGLGEK